MRWNANEGESLGELGDGCLYLYLQSFLTLIGTSPMVELSQVPRDRAMAYLRRLAVQDVLPGIPHAVSQG